MLRKALLTTMVLVAASACDNTVNNGNTGGGSGTGGSGAGGGSGGSGGSGGGADTLAQSAKANVRFKRAFRLTADYAQALSLPVGQLCNELGQYPCTTVVHPIALGGTDPYGVGLYEPLPFTGMSSPIVTDRVALSACLQRVQADLAAGGSAVVFKGVVPDGAGKLNIESAEVREAIDSLYRRATLRRATDSEVGHLKQLYKDIEATGKAQAGQSWMTLSCFAVLTSVEALFY